MAQRFANNAATTLAQLLDDDETSLVVTSGASFPTPGAGDYFLATLVGFDANGNESTWEIVKVTGVSANTWFIERAQEGTTARSWPSATRVELRATAGSLEVFLQPSDIGDTVCSQTDFRLSNARTPTSHTHGNLTNDGKVGSTSGVPLITGTGGVVQAGAFGTAAGTFCQGNDSRLSDARAPTAHAHGNLTNDGKVGATSGLPLITGTGGVVQAGAFGTTSGTFCQGNDSRLSDARAPTAHTHGSLTNDGKIGSTSGLPLITGTNGVVQTGSFGSSAGTFCQGNDSRLSDARTPTAHTHGNLTDDGKIGSTAGVPLITGTNGVVQAGSFGSSAGTYCQGNDSRLSNARTPTAHKSTHASGGSDVLTPADIGAATSAQGAKADTALQPETIGVSVQAYSALATQQEMEAGTQASVRSLSPERVRQAIGAHAHPVLSALRLNRLCAPKASASVSRSALGASLTGSSKWGGGVLAHDRKIYSIPYNSTDILIIDPNTATASRSAMGATLTDTMKWWGGVSGPDGKIYGVPMTSTDILIIDPATSTATRSAMGASLSGTSKWAGGILAPNGKIYCVPYGATDILIIDPLAGTATRSTMGANLTGSSKWLGAVLAPNGKIYCIPSNALTVLVIDPATETASTATFGLTLSDTLKWYGGALGSDGKIYGIPYNSTDILIIDTYANTATRSAMGADLSGTTKWFCGGVGADGKIYGTPRSGTDILVIDPETGTASRSAFGASLSGTGKWGSFVLGQDGVLYGVPSDAADILMVNPYSAQLPAAVTRSPYLNHF